MCSALCLQMNVNMGTAQPGNQSDQTNQMDDSDRPGASATQVQCNVAVIAIAHCKQHTIRNFFHGLLKK